MSICRFFKTLLLAFEWTESLNCPVSLLSLKLTEAHDTLFSHALCTVVFMYSWQKDYNLLGISHLFKAPPSNQASSFQRHCT